MKRAPVVILHLGYWLLYLLLLAILFLAVRLQPARSPSLGTVLFATPIGLLLTAPNLFSFYFGYGAVFPRWLAPRRFVRLAGGVLLGGIGAAIVAALSILAFSGTQYAAVLYRREAIGLFAAIAALAIVHLAVGLVLRGFIEWYDDLELKAELARKTTEMELDLIRARLDPHFLFNTLNNIDVLITKDPATASLYLNRLSDIVRFVLYETNAPAIPLAAELGYIDKYVALERLRTANPRYARCEITGDATGLMIAPMVFIPFIENAFKHVASRKADDAIAIALGIEGRRVTFRCSNRFGLAPASPPGPGGLGNELIRRRLELLYPGRHTVEVAAAGEVYTVELRLDL